MSLPLSSFSLQRPRRAFTLIELLVVISIIAVLAALILPVVGTMREKADSSASISTMKQLGAALATVSADNNLTLPLGYGNDPVLQGFKPKPPETAGYNFPMRLSYTPSMFGASVSPTTWVQLFQNKTAAKKEKFGGSTYAYVGTTPYGVNGVFDTDVKYNAISLYGDRPTGVISTLKVPNPSRCVYLADTYINPTYKDAVTGLSTADGSFNYTNKVDTASAIAYRHPGKRAALMFLDWHIEMATQDEVTAHSGKLKNWFDPSKT